MESAGTRAYVSFRLKLRELPPPSFFPNIRNKASYLSQLLESFHRTNSLSSVSACALVWHVRCDIDIGKLEIGGMYG